MEKTDWDSYYSHPFKISTFSRRITSNKLIRLMLQYAPKNSLKIEIAELGGANSCFYEAINKAFSPETYLIVDNNLTGLEMTIKRLNKANNIEIKNEDLLNSSESTGKFDIVFSVGLIEHFSPAETRKCIAAHFYYLKTNGACIITFPTPTWLYRFTRKFSELLGLWIFKDERPLEMNEVLNEISKYGIVKHRSITWPIFLTQGVLVVIKN